MREDSFTDYLDDDLRFDLFEGISNVLFDQWNDSNLNEGLLYADFRIAEMSGVPDIITAYNQHWNLKEGDEYYVGL